jgi:hypothetical protein
VTAAPVNATGGSDGVDITATEIQGSRNAKTGLFALEKADLFNLLCIPPAIRTADLRRASIKRGRILFRATGNADCRSAGRVGRKPRDGFGSGTGWTQHSRLSGTVARNAALYFPRVIQPDPCAIASSTRSCRAESSRE